MKYLRNKISMSLAVGAMAFGSIFMVPQKAEASCTTVTVCGSVCVLADCVKVCVSVQVCDDEVKNKE